MKHTGDFFYILTERKVLPNGKADMEIREIRERSSEMVRKPMGQKIISEALCDEGFQKGGDGVAVKDIHILSGYGRNSKN